MIAIIIIMDANLDHREDTFAVGADHKLFDAPLHPHPQRILDIGPGLGDWAEYVNFYVT